MGDLLMKMYFLVFDQAQTKAILHLLCPTDEAIFDLLQIGMVSSRSSASQLPVLPAGKGL
jgi:hypothetical protein